MPTFRRLHLNLWTEGEQIWIGRDSWDRGSEPFDVRMLYGKKAYVGLDLSRTTDMIAVLHDGLIYIICNSFLPAGKKGFIARAPKETASMSVGATTAGWRFTTGRAGSWR